MALEIRSRKNNLGQMCISSLGPSIWNKKLECLNISSILTFITIVITKILIIIIANNTPRHKTLYF